MASSEQVAWGMYARLNEGDRRAVDAWRSLGNGMVDSLLNSGVLGGGRSEPAADWYRRSLNPDDVVRQNTCEHEAAHAVVAHALGQGDVSATVEADGRSGLTTYRSTNRVARAVVAAAPEVWITEFRFREFPAVTRHEFSHDLGVLLRNTDGDHDVVTARRHARVILGEYREQVLAAADALARTRHLEMPPAPAVSGRR